MENKDKIWDKNFHRKDFYKNPEMNTAMSLDDVTLIKLEPTQEYCDIEGTGIPKTDLIFDFFWKEELLDKYLEKIDYETYSKLKQFYKDNKTEILLSSNVRLQPDNYEEYIKISYR